MIELVVIFGRNADNLKYEKVNLLSSKCPLFYFKYFSDCLEELLFKSSNNLKTHCCLEIEVLVMDVLINSVTAEELTAVFLAY